MGNKGEKNSEEARKEITKEVKLKKIQDFKEKILDKYGNMIKSVVMMGSVARGESKPVSDVDVFVVIDDTEREIPFEEKDKMDLDMDQIAKQIDPNISVQPSYTLTEFMDYARIGHPIIYNFIKEGEAVYDTGFFMPFKRLLNLGKIPTTREAVENYMQDAPKKLMRAKTVKLLMLAEDCYYAILNTAQAVLMFMGVEPPVPNKAYDEVKKYLVEPGILEPEYAEWLGQIVEIRKQIEHKELLDASGAFVDDWIDKSDKFVNRMYQLLSILEGKKKEKVLERTYEVIHKAAIAALKTLHKSPEKDEEVGLLFKKELIDKNVIEGYYWDIWKRIEVMKDLADKNKLDKVSEKDVYKMREYVRNLIRDLAKILKEKGPKKK